jgi:hypothetical protein
LKVGNHFATEIHATKNRVATKPVSNTATAFYETKIRVAGKRVTNLVKRISKEQRG